MLSPTAAPHCMQCLAHLSLRDCTQLAPKACCLLAAAAPGLETLDLEYCRGVCIAPLAGMRLLHHARVRPRPWTDLEWMT